MRQFSQRLRQHPEAEEEERQEREFQDREGARRHPANRNAVEVEARGKHRRHRANLDRDLRGGERHDQQEQAWKCPMEQHHRLSR